MNIRAQHAPCLTTPESSARVAMALLVRDEADVIELNIRYHASQGVCAFVVMDNDSNDGTVEILERLALEFDLTLIHQPDARYLQSKWMTQLAHLARNRYHAGIVIPSDADEFWFAANGLTLQQALPVLGAVNQFERVNLIPHPDEPFHLSTHSVVTAIPYSKQSERLRDDLSITLRTLRGKVAVRTRGLLKLTSGNHSAWHLFSPHAARRSNAVTVFHYPIRSFAQFNHSLERYQDIIKSTPNARVGGHWRRWSGLNDEASRRREFERLCFSRDELTTLHKVGILQHNPRPAAALGPLAARMQLATPDVAVSA